MRIAKMGVGFGLAVLAPLSLIAQSIPEKVRGLQGIVDEVYKETLPMCSDLISIASAIAGFAAVFYIGSRIWKNIANAEPIDFYPLFRPFVLTWCILNFELIIAVLNGILQPTVDGTNKLVDNTNQTIATLLEKRQQMMDTTRQYLMYGVNGGGGNRDTWLKFTHEDQVGNEDWMGIGNDIEFEISRIYYNIRTGIAEFLSFVLQLIYAAAILCIKTISSFNLLICAILGPIVFAISIFDGFTNTLTVYFSRYVNFYLWVPVGNILGMVLGKIQELMIKEDILQLAATGDSFLTPADAGYMIFMIIGIVAYTTVPNMASLIVHTGADSAINRKMTGMLGGVAGMAMSAATAPISSGGGFASDSLGDQNNLMSGGTAGSGASSNYFKDKLSG